MRQQRILWINPGCHLIHSGTLRKDGCLILDITLVLDVELAVVVGYGEEHFHSDILWLEVSDVQNDLCLERVAWRK